MKKEALALLREIDEIYSSKGKSVIRVDLHKQKPDEEMLLALLLGPSGKLRAPALRKGRTLIIGFDMETYTKLLA